MDSSSDPKANFLSCSIFLGMEKCICKRIKRKIEIRIKNRNTPGLKKHIFAIHKNKANDVYHQNGTTNISAFFGPPEAVSIYVLI